MATAPQLFVPVALPTRRVWASNTTLFQLAATYLGNALLWTYIAQANNLIDPWIFGPTQILIPQNIPPQTAPTGILGA